MAESLLENVVDRRVVSLDVESHGELVLGLGEGDIEVPEAGEVRGRLEQPGFHVALWLVELGESDFVTAVVQDLVHEDGEATGVSRFLFPEGRLCRAVGHGRVDRHADELRHADEAGTGTNDGGGDEGDDGIAFVGGGVELEAQVDDEAFDDVGAQMKKKKSPWCVGLGGEAFGVQEKDASFLLEFGDAAVFGVEEDGDRRVPPEEKGHQARRAVDVDVVGEDTDVGAV
mmetsp:Transcript_15691/g.51341  ORF Transcript_15691/g.51341 Transcript_15691/m.51341 type:complete len:229 (+) Transcript_15691:239-925(+)